MVHETEKIFLEIDPYDLAEKIEKIYSHYGTNISINKCCIKSDRVIFKVKLKGNTRAAHVRSHARDVQLRLKLKLFEIFIEDLTICIAVSNLEIIYESLPACIAKHKGKLTKMLLPYVIGHNITNELVVIDLSKSPHLLLGGATNSGKTVGLQALITCIITCKPSNFVNLILIDVGAADLMIFDGIPHLACPVIKEKNAAYHAILSLQKELERRIQMQITDSDTFNKLPRLLLVIDEFPALFSGIDKNLAKSLTDALSGLLQRGRHAKIHVVLAAQNPTIQNMHVDLGNITTRIAFRCAKKNFSETILGERGAENLSGKGDMYLKSPDYTELQRIQGIFIAPGKLSQIVKHIQILYSKYSLKRNPYEFTLSTDQLNELQTYTSAGLYRPVDTKQQIDDQLLAQIVVWVLGEEAISCNSICNKFHIGWNRAKRFLDKLQDMGLVGDIYAKLPRSVLPYSVSDIPQDTMDFLQSNNVLQKEIIQAISNRVNR